MTVSEVKELFRQVRKAHSEIRHIMLMIQEEEANLLPKAIQYDRDKVQVSVDDTLAKYAAEITEMQEQLGKSLYTLKKSMTYAESLLTRLEDSDEREVMRYYYLDTNKGVLYKWFEVANLMGYDERTIYRIHGDALKHLSEKLSVNVS